MNDGNFDLVQTSFDWARKDPAVVFILILDESNQTIIEHNPRNLKYNTTTLMQDLKFEDTKDIVLESRPVEYKGKKLGTTFVGISMESVMSVIMRQILTEFGIVLVFVVLGTWWVVRSTRSLVRDIKMIQKNIENADLNTQINSGRQDEMGQLQNSFDRFVGLYGIHCFKYQKRHLPSRAQVLR